MGSGGARVPDAPESPQPSASAYAYDVVLILLKLAVLAVCASRSGSFVYQAF
jgi:hypothetical protein